MLIQTGVFHKLEETKNSNENLNNNKMIWLLNKQIKKYKNKQMVRRIKIKYLSEEKKFYFNLKNKVQKTKINNKSEF